MKTSADPAHRGHHGHGHDRAHVRGHDHEHEHEHEHGHDHGPSADRTCCHGAGEPATPSLDAGLAWFRIPTMDCAVEEAEIRRALEPVPGIASLRFQLAARVLGIDAPAAALPTAMQALRAAGFAPQALDGGSPAAAAFPPWQGGESLRLAAALALAVVAEVLHWVLPEGASVRAVGVAVALGAIALAGVATYTKGLSALRHGRLNISALMTVAVTGAFLIGQMAEAAMVMALYAIAEALEARAVDRARRAVAALQSLAPERAQVQQPDGQWQVQPVASVAVGSLVRIRPGERVPLDAMVTRGSSSVDEAAITGESLPVDKAEGSPLYAGTINHAGELVCRVTAAAGQSTLARIAAAVERAQGSRAPTQRFVDRFAAVYTPVVFMVALAVAVLPPLLLGWPWLEAVYKALVLLVIACPCALVIATPVSVVSALAWAARHGILIKGGGPLEQAGRLRAIALDKTGTLTQGRPRLVQATVPAGSPAETSAWAALLAARSDHPVAQAIAAGLPAAQGEVAGFTALPGRGVTGVIGGRRLWLASPRWVQEQGLPGFEPAATADPGAAVPDAGRAAGQDGAARQHTQALESGSAWEPALSAHLASGHSVTLLADGQQVLAMFAVADTLRPSATPAVNALKALGIVPVVLSGDHPAAVSAVAAQAGVAEAQGGMLPEDKLQAIQALQARFGLTAMVGDGINDAPALAQSSLGIAMGGAGSHIAIEAADVVIMNDDLGRLATTVALSRRTRAVLWQNIVLALGVKAVFFGLAVFGSATLWMAVFADMGTSLLVVANGLRLLRMRQ